MKNSRGGLGDIPSPGRACDPPASGRPRRAIVRERVSGPKNRPCRRVIADCRALPSCVLLKIPALTAAAGPCLGTQPPAIMLDRKDVAVERRGPLLALHGHLEISQSVTDISLDLAPIELWIAVDHICGTGIAEPFVNAVFDEFVVERIQLAEVERIA